MLPPTLRRSRLCTTPSGAGRAGPRCRPAAKAGQGVGTTALPETDCGTGHLGVQPGPAIPHRLPVTGARPARRPPRLGALLPVAAHPRLRAPFASRGDRLREPPHGNVSAPGTVFLLQLHQGRRERSAPRSPAVPATAILDSSRQRPFQGAPLSRGSGSAPHLRRGLNRVKSQSSRTGGGREGRRMKNKTEGRGMRGQGDALSSGISPKPPP